jgi:hypothetical protein
VSDHGRLGEVPVAAGRVAPAGTLLSVIGLVWIGLLLGVSFLATPVKFLAPSLTLPVALEVGQQTFEWFSRVEIVLALAALVSAVIFRPRAWVTGLTALLLAVVGLQIGWLLPLLDTRVEVILQGSMPPPSILHSVYVALEAAKLVVLGVVSWIALRGRPA